MKSQICTFILVASIIWQSSGYRSQNTFKPSSENVTKTCVIETGEAATFSKFTQGINIIFNDIRAHMSRITHNNNKNVSNQETSLTSLSEKELYTAFAQGVEIYLDTVQRLTRNYNSWADTIARRLFHESLLSLVENIYKALNLTVNEDYFKIQHEIQELQKATASQATAVSKGAFIGIKQGRQFSDEIQSIIASLEEKVLYFAVHSINDIFAGIRTLSNISSGNKTKSEDTVLAMENSQKEAIAALTSGAKYVYVLIRVLYCTLSVDQMDTSTFLATLDSQHEKANRKTKQGIDIFVSVIKSTASNAMEANSNEMKNQSCINEIAENEVYEAWLKAVNYLLDSNSLVQAVKPSIDTTSRLVVANRMKDAVRLTFEGIRAAQNENYAKCMLRLDQLQNERIASDLMLTQGLYMAIRNCRNNSDEMTKMINHAHDTTVAYVISGSTGIFDGIRFLANVLSKSKDSRHVDWSGLDTAASKAYSGWTKEIDIYYELLNSFVISSSVENDDIVSYFVAIRSTRDMAISEFCKSIRLIFTKMETDLKDIYPENDDSSCEESTQHSSQQSANKDFKNETTVTLRRAINAIMDLLATTHLANSSAVKFGVTASGVATMDTIDDIFRSIDSAEEEECSENVSELHNTESSSITRAIAIFKSIFDVIRSGQKNGSDKNEAAIKEAESKTISNTISAWQAMYDGIASFKSEMDRERTENSYSAMKVAEMKACSAMETNVKIIITLIRTLVVSPNTKPDTISTTFAMIQSARKITSMNCQIALGIILKSITRDVANTTSRHQSQNQSNMVSPTSKNICRQSIKSDPVANLTYYTFKRAADAFYDLIPAIQPEATATVETVRSGMYLAIEQFVEDIFFAIELIHFNFSSEVLAEIGIMEKTADCALTAVVENYYIPLKYDLEPGTETYNYVKNAEADTITMILETWKPIFTGLKILFYESFPAMDDGYRAHLPLMDEIENKSRYYQEALVQTIYDTVVHKFVHSSKNHHEMLNSTCPCTRV